MNKKIYEEIFSGSYVSISQTYKSRKKRWFHELGKELGLEQGVELREQLNKDLQYLKFKAN